MGASVRHTKGDVTDARYARAKRIIHARPQLVEQGQNARPPSRGQAVGGNYYRGSCSANLFQGRDLCLSWLILAAPQQRDPDTDWYDMSPVHPRITRLCRVWTSLTEHAILAILALADSHRVLEATRLQPPS
jgi:hypothetical protein